MDTTPCALPPPMGGAPQDEIPTTTMPPDMEKSRLSISRSPPGATRQHACSPPSLPGATRQHVIHERTMRKHLPYPPQYVFSSAPITPHWTTQFMGQGHQKEFSLDANQKYKEELKSGLSRMSSSTLYKGYKVKLAAREASRQRLLLTAWELEEARRFSTFLDAIHAEEEELLKSTEEELQDFRRMISQRSRAEVDGDKTYLQAVYEDECKVLCMISTQADEVANLLGKCAKQSFLRFTGDSSPYATNEPCGIGNRVRTRESSTLEDSEGSASDMGVCHDDNLEYSDVDSKSESDD